MNILTTVLNIHIVWWDTLGLKWPGLNIRFTPLVAKILDLEIQTISLPCGIIKMSVNFGAQGIDYFKTNIEEIDAFETIQALNETVMHCWNLTLCVPKIIKRKMFWTTVILTCLSLVPRHAKKVTRRFENYDGKDYRRVQLNLNCDLQFNWKMKFPKYSYSSYIS